MKLILCGSIIFLLSACSSVDVGTEKEKEKASYEQTRQVLLDKEQNNPLMFLSVSGGSKKNLIGQTVLNGRISNSATIAVFKDIEVKMDFYSGTKALLESDNETMFLQVRPGQAESFKTKYFAPKGTDSVAFSIKSAKVVTQ